ncbi:hypothetical protein SNK05_003375 [Fusarium graminearum]
MAVQINQNDSIQRPEDCRGSGQPSSSRPAPTASDWQSADARNVNVGAGKVEGSVGTDAHAQSGLREPATKGEEVDLSNVGREGVEKNQQ